MTRVIRQGRMTVVPLVIMVVGFMILMAGATTTLLPQATVSFSAGPYTQTISGISPFSASLLFIGGILIIVGAVMYASMARGMRPTPHMR